MKQSLSGLFIPVLLLIGSLMMTSCYGQKKIAINTVSPNMTINQIDPDTNHLIYKGRLVEVYVEKTIYHSAANKNFLMKFLIKNVTGKTIGVDLSNYSKMIYPNQWGFSPKPYRETIDEIQIIPDKTIDKDELLKKFANNSLTMIKPSQTLEYYRDWDGRGEKVESTGKDEFLLITVDGQLLFTDGEGFEYLTLDEADDSMRVVVLSSPINHRTIPEKAMIISSKF